MRYDAENDIDDAARAIAIMGKDPRHPFGLPGEEFELIWDGMIGWEE